MHYHRVTERKQEQTHGATRRTSVHGAEWKEAGFERLCAVWLYGMQFWKGKLYIKETRQYFQGLQWRKGWLLRGVRRFWGWQQCTLDVRSHVVIKIHRNEHLKGFLLQQWHFKNRKATPANKRAGSTTLLLTLVFITQESLDQQHQHYFRTYWKFGGLI